MILNEVQKPLAAALLGAMKADMERLGMTKAHGNGKQGQYAEQILRVSPAALTQLLSEQWQDISESRFNGFLAHFGLVSVSDTWTIEQKAGSFKSIHRTCDDAVARNRFLAICAPTGTGKTTALELYAKSSNALYVLCDAFMSARDLVEEIQATYGDKTKGNLRKRIVSIAKRLNGRKSLLILDDFGKLNDDSYRALQLIYDLTNKAEAGRSCGIVISGVEYMQTKLEQGVKNSKKCFAELHSRIENWQGLPSLKTADVDFFCKKHGIFEAEAVAKIRGNSADFRQLRANIDNYLYLQHTQNIHNKLSDGSN